MYRGNIFGGGRLGAVNDHSSGCYDHSQQVYDHLNRRYDHLRHFYDHSAGGNERTTAFNDQNDRPA